MEKVSGIGGIFFKAADKEKLMEWYRKHLGIDVQDWGGTAFEWRLKDNPDKSGATIWSVFPKETKYFEPTSSEFMVNYRVENLDKMIAQLREAGVEVDEKIEESEFGRFGWARDAEGNRFELWQPPEESSCIPREAPWSAALRAAFRAAATM